MTRLAATSLGISIGGFLLLHEFLDRDPQNQTSFFFNPIIGKD